MNLQRIQKPYVFRPPRPARWFRPLLHLISTAFLRFRFRIRRLSVKGEQTLVQLTRAGQSVLVTPNHADHADPCLLVEAGRRVGLTLHFMAARECFERGPVNCFVLQRSGAFSVDREGNDLASLRTAMNLLRTGGHPLVIFPEGEIYHHHEELDLLNEGPATIALRAAEKLPAGRRAYAIPTAIRIRHDAAVESTFGPRLEVLERRITWKPRRHLSVPDRILRIGSALLSIKEEEFLGETRRGDLHERILWLQEFLVGSVEGRHDLRPTGSELPHRISTLRHRIRLELLSDVTGRDPQRREQLEDDLDHLFAAQQLYSYRGRYLESRPTLDRIAETLFKLEEDVLGAGTYPAARSAEIAFGDPIGIGTTVRASGRSARASAATLTRELRERIQDLLSVDAPAGPGERTETPESSAASCRTR